LKRALALGQWTLKRAGDVGYVEETLAHYAENTGNEDLRFLEMFTASRYEDVSPSEWLSHTPPRTGDGPS
jgi:oxalate decarboxylase